MIPAYLHPPASSDDQTEVAQSVVLALEAGQLGGRT